MIKKSGQKKTVAQLREEREKRIMNAIHLKLTDRVPIICGVGYFPGRYAGVPTSAAYYDPAAWIRAYREAMPHYPADMIYHQPIASGKALEILQPKQLRWPGHGVDPNLGHQSIEIDNMQPDEYDAFLDDASDYMFRIHLSRTSDNLTALAKFPKLSGLSGAGGAQTLAITLADPDVVKTISILQKTGRELRKNQKWVQKFNQMMLDLGFPQYFQGGALPPFDIISHSMRGMTGTMLDMYRQPKKVLETCDKILEQTLARPLPPASPLGYIRYFMTNTRGSDDFMSNAQFEKFYWPTCKKLLLTLIKRGVTPCMFFEGNFTSKLEFLLQLPKGKMLARLDTTDIFKAKEILKDHVCIQGNVPSSLLQVGTVQEVKDYCRKLIDVVGKGGGFILSPRSSTDEVKPENLKAMIDFTQEYGVY